MARFRVRSITATSKFLKHYYLMSLAQQGWRPCFGDIDCYLQLDPTGVMVGQLNDKPVGTTSAIKYGDGHRHFGSYRVEEEYRGFGFGLKLTEASTSIDFGLIKNASLYTSPEMAKKAKNMFKMHCRWTVGIYDVNITKALHKLPTYTDVCEVKKINDINMQDLYKYDTNVFGYEREKFLEKWLTTPGTHVRVALAKDGSILGYVVVKTAFLYHEVYKIGPLYCENIEVGKALLKGVFEEVRQRGLSSSNSVIVDSPTGRNPDAKELMELVEGSYLGYNEFLTRSGLQNGRFDSWFAITSPVCG